MFWSAALELKTQPRKPLATYGSFSRCHIPQSIPEHQPVSQFTSPHQRRVEEYVERPDTAFARSRASLQLSAHTQSALKLLLQTERKPQVAPDVYSRSKLSGYGALQKPMKKLPARAHGQDEANPQEDGNEHNYWMQELERRRAGLKRSRRRTCTPMSERATTSPLKVGVVMCSVPLVLVLGFVLFVFLFGDGRDAGNKVMDVVNNLLGDDDGAAALEHRRRIARSFARPPEEEESPVMKLDVSADHARLRGAE